MADLGRGEVSPDRSRSCQALSFLFRVRITINNLTKRFGDTLAVDQLSLEVHSEELFFLLGPSGCGKTTLLRTLAGFYQADSGEMTWGDRSMNGVPPHERNCGMVFQNYALWPHLTVAENVAYGLEVRRLSATDVQRRVQEALAMTRMEAYSKRMPTQLSGGQQQRVALARALVIRPDLLLLDEPLSNLDAQLRLEMREEIRRIHDETKITTVYVTHDQKEALSLADRMAIFRQGKIEQVGDPRAIYRSPKNRFVAEFIGETNWISGRMESADADGCTVQTDLGLLRMSVKPGDGVGTSVRVGFRPEAVEISDNAPHAMECDIAQVSYLGDTEQYLLRTLSGYEMKAVEQNPVRIRQRGERIRVGIRPEHFFIVPADRAV